MSCTGHTREEFWEWAHACVPEGMTLSSSGYTDGDTAIILDAQGRERIDDEEGSISASIYRESQSFGVNSLDELLRVTRSVVGLPTACAMRSPDRAQSPG